MNLKLIPFAVLTSFLAINSYARLDSVSARNKPGGQALAEKLLPTQSGFLFGRTDIGEYYYQDLEKTVKIVEECEKYPDAEFTCYSSC